MRRILLKEVGVLAVDIRGFDGLTVDNLVNNDEIFDRGKDNQAAGLFTDPVINN